MPFFRRHTPFALGVGLLFVAGLARSQAPDPLSVVQPSLTGTRGPYEVAFTPDGKRALVTEWDEGAVAVIETATGQVVQHVPTGSQPTGVAVSPDGQLALVTNSAGGSLSVVHLNTLRVETVPLRGFPFDVVITPDGATACVSLSQLDQVVFLDLASRQVVETVAVGRRPRTLALSQDGKVLAVANFQGGSVTFLSPQSRRVIGVGPTPAVNLKGVALFPNSARAYCIGQRAQNERATETPIGVWSNQSFIVRPGGGPNGDVNLWLDLMGKDVAEPDSVVFDPEGRRIFMTCGGGHSVNTHPAQGDGDTVTIRHVGAQPRGLSFTPDGKELWVACQLSNDVAVIDPVRLTVSRRISLGPTQRKDPHLLGRFLFNSATLTKGGQFSCNSCHPDGGTDGISWKFVHVPDGLGRETPRNVRVLAGGLTDTAPFRWTGHDANLEEFVQTEVTKLLGGPELGAERVRAIADYIASLPAPPNPYRGADGSLTGAAQRGKTLFSGKADCIQCHTGPKSGGGRKANIGTTPAGVDLDVPHLTGVFDSDPYLHHGKAKSLEAIWEQYDPEKKHGKVQGLTPDEMRDLLAYVREL